MKRNIRVVSSIYYFRTKRQKRAQIEDRNFVVQVCAKMDDWISKIEKHTFSSEQELITAIYSLISPPKYNDKIYDLIVDDKNKSHLFECIIEADHDTVHVSEPAGKGFSINVFKFKPVRDDKCGLI